MICDSLTILLYHTIPSISGIYTSQNSLPIDPHPHSPTLYKVPKVWILGVELPCGMLLFRVLLLPVVVVGLQIGPPLDVNSNVQIKRAGNNFVLTWPYFRKSVLVGFKEDQITCVNVDGTMIALFRDDQRIGTWPRKLGITTIAEAGDILYVAWAPTASLRSLLDAQLNLAAQDGSYTSMYRLCPVVVGFRLLDD